MFQPAINQYLKKYNYSQIQLKAVLFDMDGVLFDSMPNHARAWHEATKKRGLCLSHEEAYLHEGRTGAGTINLICRRQWGREATQEEIEDIYKVKSEEFNKCPQAAVMPGADEILGRVKSSGCFSVLVTGSGQESLFEKLDQNFPRIFRPELMVTAFDVKHGKPHPEPYLMALDKGRLKANEAVVVENAPLGVQAAAAAGIFTIAVNTGPLEDKILLDAGANILFPSMEVLSSQWENLREELGKTIIGFS